MPDILLTTVNAKHAHTAFSLRWLWANLGHLREQAVIREYTLRNQPSEIVEAWLDESPRIIGVSVYIWNVDIVTRAVAIMKGIRPDVVIVLGGPEVSYEHDSNPLASMADYLVTGEGEEAFAWLASELLAGRRPVEKIITAPRLELRRLVPPYDAYSDEDVSHRIVYVEASRGCPFRCAFCLSALEGGVREFPLTCFIDDMKRLLDRGARRIKFVDRTFNYHEDRAVEILNFFLDQWREGLQVHFEIVPDRLSPRIMERMAQFPSGGLRLEAGVQSLNQASLDAIRRSQDSALALENIRWLCKHTGAIVHADLVAGLPNETWRSFRDGFDQLLAIGPSEIQLGILKRLRGSPITLIAEAHGLVFSPHPPYEVLQTQEMNFTEIQRLKRIARYFELYHNSGDFPRSMAMLWESNSSSFEAFAGLSNYIWKKTGRTHELALRRLAELLYSFLVEHGQPVTDVANALRADYHRLPGRRDKLAFE